jgi:hypothetical protein
MKNNITIRKHYNKFKCKKNMAGYATIGPAGSMTGGGPWWASL